jgi:hypothetical protein
MPDALRVPVLPAEDFPWRPWRLQDLPLRNTSVLLSSKGREPGADDGGALVELVPLSRSPDRVDPEAVSGEPGEDVQVHVEDLLEGRLAVGQEEIDALTAQARPA